MTEKEEKVEKTEKAEKTEQVEKQEVSATSQANLEAIMHIPLEVSVELGRVRLPLHEVVRLNRGTVLQLHKEANATVEILANGIVFAQGEVVKADGKLGVRVTEVVSPAERVRALA